MAGRARRAPRARRPWIAIAVVAIVAVLLVRGFVLQVFWVASSSMEPTLRPGDRVLVDELPARVGSLHRGDIVVFDDPTAPAPTATSVFGRVTNWLLAGIGAAAPQHGAVIKRVIALPGETWEIRRGAVYVDGRRLAEPYLGSPRDRRSFGPGRVPPEDLFVLGDNRTDSEDSRFPQLGYVPRDTVVGRAVAVVWPPSDAGWR